MKPAVRTVIVQSPSVVRETGLVLRAVAHIAIWSAAIMGASRCHGRNPNAPRAASSLPDVELFRDLDSEAQRVFRASLEGLTEAEDVRSRSGDWPSIEALAAKKIPPFAPDPLDAAGYRWQLMRDGALIDYVGTPTAAGRPSFVISILEPDPSMAVDPQAITDETHHKLRDGTLLHVGVYAGPRTLTSPMATPPFEDGWRRITTYNP